MGRGFVNIALLAALAGVVLLTWTLRRDFTMRNYEFLPGMVDSVPFDAHHPNPNFTDGKTLREPPPGAIPRGFERFPYTAVAADAVRAGEELHNPFADTGASARDRSGQGVLERGAVVYVTFCQPCHGTGGGGDGPVIQRGFPPPPSLAAQRALQMKDGQMFHILTYGQGNMPSLAAQINRDDRWKVVRYVRQLQRSAAGKGE